MVVIVIIIIMIIIVIVSAANVYLALMLYISNLITLKNPIQLDMFSYYPISQMKKLMLRVIK